MTTPLRLVTFRRAGVAYGVDVERVRKVLRSPPVRSLPASPSFVPGAITVDGRLEVLVDLASLLDPESDPGAGERVILVSADRGDFALVADEAGEVAELDAGSVQPVPPFVAAAGRHALAGVAVRGREEILILDLGRLLEGSDVEAAAGRASIAPEDRGA